LFGKNDLTVDAKSRGDSDNQMKIRSAGFRGADEQLRQAITHRAKSPCQNERKGPTSLSRCNWSSASRQEGMNCNTCSYEIRAAGTIPRACWHLASWSQTTPLDESNPSASCADFNARANFW